MVDSPVLVYKTVRWQILQQASRCDWAAGSECVNTMSDILKCLSTWKIGEILLSGKKLQIEGEKANFQHEANGISDAVPIWQMAGAITA